LNKQSYIPKVRDELVLGLIRLTLYAIIHFAYCVAYYSLPWR